MTVAILLLAVLLGVLLFAARKPDILEFCREIEINAPPEKIFSLINDFHCWPEWAPQDTADSSMKRAFSGPPNGRGAVSRWTSNGSAGRGKMEIIESAPPVKVKVNVEFEKPFNVINVNEFIIEPAGSATRVTWRMKGANPFPAKVMSVVFPIDRIMGKHFEDGLRSLKTVSERQDFVSQ